MWNAGEPVVGYRFDQPAVRQLMDAMRTSEAAPQAGDQGTVTVQADNVAVILVVGYGGRQDALIRFYDASGCLTLSGSWPWNDVTASMVEAGLAWRTESDQGPSVASQ
jgi:hypothetical protein